ncbi:MAG: YjfB family protein [Cellulosilyticum sp.]|nr:YjfB family protein [Cellulosilyticum sp.]
MDIAALSTALAQQDLGTAVGVAVAKLTMDTAEQNGANLAESLKQMELSVNPNLGSNIDIRL